MNLEDLHKVWEIKALKKPGEEEACNILNRISKQVQPIMRRRRWRVKVLSEFCPTNPSLLGLNVGAGSEVKLRLRRPNRDWDFFPFEQVLDTMLHELCHIEHGPHNAQFYKLWDELRKECDDLVAKGIAGTGEGFDGPGRRLGGFTRQPPASSLRQTALAAAQKRARVGPLLPSGPRRLGGDDVIMSSLSPIQAAAMAAERRMLDDLWCGSVSPEIERINGLEALGESPNNSSHRSTAPSVSTSSLCAVDSIDDKLAWECKVCTLLNQKRARVGPLLPSGPRRLGGDDVIMSSLSPIQAAAMAAERRMLDDLWCGSVSPEIERINGLEALGESPNNSSHRSTAPSVSTSSLCAVDSIDDKLAWECKVCTLLNQPLAPICEACGTQMPKPLESNYKIWSCKFCTLENSIKLDKCSACEQWRYSYGPPVSTRSPNYGT